MAGAKPGVHVVQLRPICVPEYMVKGSKFIKWDDSCTIGTPVTLKVDPKGYILYWKDQNKTSTHDATDMDYLDISLIRDARTGKYAKVPKEGKLRDSCSIGPQDIPVEEKTISVCWGTDMVQLDWVNFVCASREIALDWSKEIVRYATNLLAQNGSVLSFLEKAHTKLTHVLDVNGRIPVKNIVKLVATHRDDRRRVEKALEAAGFLSGKNDTIDPNRFTFEVFFNFYRHLGGRTEVDKVFDEIGAKKKPYLTAEQFVQFLNREQRDPRLNEILYPYYTIKQAQEFIDIFETKAGMAEKEAGHLSQEGFLKFLMSEENNIIPAEKLDLSSDMNQPLPHYFINSSHNTYLTGHQLTGKSSVEIYRQVLLSGCRCIELDCWDGRNAEEEPVITHGYTMCTEVLFKEVIEAIAESAFKTSDYPVILSFENHCSHKQQAKMANHCRTVFGEALVADLVDGYELESDVHLPSPELLKGRVLIKNKKKHFHKEKQLSQKGSKTKSDGAGDAEGVGVGGKAVGELIAGEKKRLESENSEDKTGVDDLDKEKLVDPTVDYDTDSDSSDDEFVPGLTEEEAEQRLREQNEKGTAGSEAEAGMEMSALVNYVQPVHFHSFELSDKRGRSYEISSFVETQATNLLKEYPVEFVNYNKRQLSRIYPRGTRVDSSNFMPQIFWNAGCQLVALNFQTLDLAMQLNLGIFEYNCRTGYTLKPDFMRRKDRHFDPFAESTVDGIVAGTVSVRVISGQLLSDKKVGTYVEVDMYGLPTDTVRKRFKTRIVQNNGVNPVYDEEPFVFKKVVLPNLAVIRIAVYEDQGRLIGHRVLPVDGLRPGYRHIPLRNECNQPLLLPSLFVHISVKDFVPDAFADFAEALTNPMAWLSRLEKHAQLLAALEEDFEMDDLAQHGNSQISTPVQKDMSTNASNSYHVSPTRGSCGSPAGLPLESNGVQRHTRIPSQPHVQVKKQESTSSGFSQASSASGGTQGSRLLSNVENGTPPQSVTATTKLNDSSLVEHTPLHELKLQKGYLKIVQKRDKELESLRKKHEKSRENMKEIHELQEEKLMLSQLKNKSSLHKTHNKSLKKASKSGIAEEIEKRNKEEYDKLVQEQDDKHKDLKRTQAEVFVELCQDQFKAEMEVYQRYHEPMHDSLKQVVENNHQEQLRRISQIHDLEVQDLKKRMDAQSRDDMKALAKKHKDKQELSRIKREAYQKYITLAVQERQKLKDLLDRRLEDLQSRLAKLMQEFEEEKEKTYKQYAKDLDEKCRKLVERFKDVLGSDYLEERVNSEDENTTL